MITVTRHEEFEAAHILDGYDGPCGNLHGHTYKFEVTLAGKTSNNFGFICDFNIVKKIMKKVLPDHKFIANKCNVDEEGLEQDIVHILNKYHKDYVLYPFSPSAENMVKYFAKEIQKEFRLNKYTKNIKVIHAKLWETTNSFAEWNID